MYEPAAGLVVAPATTDADLESMAYVRGRVNPLGRPPRVENLRHIRDTSPGLTYLVARVEGEPAGCGFVEPSPASHAQADVSVVPELRGRGGGTSLLAAVSARARSVQKAREIDRPTRRPDLCFIALAGDDVIGYAALDVFGDDGGHALTAVKRTWRRRGVATALKHAEIAAAKRAGFRRLFTGSEERNLPMRRLNAKLGYKPEPSLSTLFVRGSLA